MPNTMPCAGPAAHLPFRSAGTLACVLAGALTLSACTSSQAYPSLARRDAERVSGVVEPVAPETGTETGAAALTGPADGLVARLEALTARARAAHQRFAAERARAEGLVAGARGAGVASESWSAATAAISSLESARSDAMISLAEIDALHVTDSITHAGSVSGDASALEAARQAVSALIADQDRVLAALHARLAG
jgi:hypothetical protein